MTSSAIKQRNPNPVPAGTITPKVPTESGVVGANAKYSDEAHQHPSALATKTPASAAATGTAGTVTWDADYIYVCTATDTWKRAAIATWP